ncbi:MAG: hypothetical protein ABR562_08450 [Thermoplasmatota archaeon]|nr:hypothetical protein [Halobacteriales archaeon]
MIDMRTLLVLLLASASLAVPAASADDVHQCVGKPSLGWTCVDAGEWGACQSGGAGLQGGRACVTNGSDTCATWDNGMDQTSVCRSDLPISCSGAVCWVLAQLHGTHCTTDVMTGVGACADLDDPTQSCVWVDEAGGGGCEPAGLP